ncbi:MAG: hypothetical protein AB3N21_06105 [Ruegeria sp.]|uniref:hypothetical protein n=1 Tax=Ruegeria sp. TaxID=1879320 RepID=UPI00349E9068
MSSHATRIYSTTLARHRSVAVCGYPRSGTSWISEVLAAYYGLPVPRHYRWPQLYPQVLHTHDLRLGALFRVFYLVRPPRALFVSLFVKRYSLTDAALGPADALRDRFTAFLQAELARPHEAPSRWACHVAAAFDRFGAEAVLVYSRSADGMAKQLARRIKGLDGHCDRARLRELMKAPPGTDAPTTITPPSARAFDWFDDRSEALIRTEQHRLHTICPAARNLPLFDAE